MRRPTSPTRWRPFRLARRRGKQGPAAPLTRSAVITGRTGRWRLSLFNTIVPPNYGNSSFSYCSRLGSGGRSDLSNADSWHPGGVNVTMADGSVRFVKDSINIQTWMALGTKAGGEVISSDSY